MTDKTSRQKAEEDKSRFDTHDQPISPDSQAQYSPPNINEWYFLLKFRKNINQDRPNFELQNAMPC